MHPLIYASETWTLTKRDRKQINVFERKVYRRILDLVYDSKGEKVKQSRYRPGVAQRVPGS
jgi:hypothetical protein